MAGAQRFIIFDDDYPPLSLSRFTSPVQTITRTVLDIRIVQGLVGILTEREPVRGELVEEQSMIGAVVEGLPIAASIAERETLTCELVTRDSIIGILED